MDRRIAAAALGLTTFGYATELIGLAGPTIWIWWHNRRTRSTVAW
jgi:hypothetical protein